MARSQRTDVDAPAPAKSDAYVGLLLISLLAQIAGAALFYIDWSQYGEAKPKLPPAATVPAGAGAGGGPAGAPPPAVPKAGIPK
jgi:hypothetical protein